MSTFVIAVEKRGMMASEIRYFGVREICELNDIITDDVDYYSTAEAYFEELLNDAEPIKIGSLEYYQLGKVFNTIDPIAFRESLLDYIDGGISDLEYEQQQSDGAVFETFFMDLSIKILDKERVESGGWIYGLTADDLSRCTDNHIHENFSELLDYLNTEELAALMRAFGEYLDDNFGGIKIGENYYFASQILYEMDISDYDRMLDDWLIKEAKSAVIDITDGVASIVIPFCEKNVLYKIREEALQ